MNPIYLDYNGTTPIHPQIRQMMAESLLSQQKENEFISNCFGNPSSSHVYGVEAKQSLNLARKQTASLIDCQPSEIVFTSGGTESNNMAIQGVVIQAYVNGNHQPHIVTSSFEHPAVENVLRVCKQLYNARVTVLNVDNFGFINLQDLSESLTTDTCLVTIMLANNEIGTVNPQADIFSIVSNFNNANKMSIKLHMDASQASGKIPVTTEADLITLAGHKMYAPKGVGCLYIKQGTKLYKSIEGAGQETNLRAGTENVLYIRAFGLACAISKAELSRRIAEHAHYIQIIYDKVKQFDHKVNGFAQYLFNMNQFEAHFTTKDLKTLPNTLNISFPGIPSNSLIAALNEKVCVSAGAACHSDEVKLSAVLKAIGVSNEVGMGTLRITVGDGLTEQMVEQAAQTIAEVVAVYQGQAVKPVVKKEETRKEDIYAMPVLAHVPQIETKVEAKQNIQTCPEQTQNMLNLTQGLGCACKLRPQLLDRILKSLDFGKDPKLVIDGSTNDDAAVYLQNDTPIVLTTDFFSPVIDDPYLYGKIASSNALSDIYAMNAKPLTCLAVCGFNSSRMSDESIRNIMRGAIDVCKSVNVVIAGGHTIESIEPFFGLVCVGSTQMSNIRRNIIGFNPNTETYLIMTKQLGVGMVATGIKKGCVPKQSALYWSAANNMAEVNSSVEKVQSNMQFVNALTDITGFGLVGHLAEMLGELSAEVYFKSLPLIPGIKDLYDDFNSQVVNNFNNFEYATQRGFGVQVKEGFQKAIFCDPTTSGGLLFAVDGIENARTICQAVNGSLIGRVYQGKKKEIIVVDEVFREHKERVAGFFKE
ncbi:Cysteine_desulfurase / Selenide [Hexamita inflata]|uniref:Water dikinase n=1 Tax=Hexamita inflata TaxID=28002 RepID=A0AA86NB24_9EUKA|nr:Cysteine desulfurase / Selenide [Hexamita inflata]